VEPGLRARELEADTRAAFPLTLTFDGQQPFNVHGVPVADKVVRVLMPINSALIAQFRKARGCGAVPAAAGYRDQVVDRARPRAVRPDSLCRHDDPAARGPGAAHVPEAAGYRGYRLPRAGVSSLGIPVAPAYAGEASLVRRKRPPGLPLIRSDDVLRLPDLLLQFGDRLLGLAGSGRLGRLAHRKPGGLDILQDLAKLLELGPVPRNGAVTVYRHANPPDSPPNLARMGQVGPSLIVWAVAKAHRRGRRLHEAIPDFDPILPSKRPSASFQTTNLRGDLSRARCLLSSWWSRISARCHGASDERS